MTREEAVEHLDTIGQYYSQDHSDPYDECERLTKDELDAIYLAIKELQDNSYELWKESYEVEHERNIRLEEKIKALEQEPCEDCISREDALMCMTGEYLADKEYKPEDIISKHIRRLRALPSVTPQTKTGHWIDDCGGVKCSRCGYMIDDCFYAKTYCTNCGCRMESEVENDN
jgi:hypothetical protein